MQQHSNEHKLAGPKMKGADEPAEGNHIGQIMEPHFGAFSAGQIVNGEKQAGNAEDNEKKKSRTSKTKRGAYSDAVLRNFGRMDVL